MPRGVDDDSRRAIDGGDFYSSHRDKRGEVGARGLAFVVRLAKPNEAKSNPKAQAAFNLEHTALCNDLKAWYVHGRSQGMVRCLGSG